MSDILTDPPVSGDDHAHAPAPAPKERREDLVYQLRQRAALLREDTGMTHAPAAMEAAAAELESLRSTIATLTQRAEGAERERDTLRTEADGADRLIRQLKSEIAEWRSERDALRAEVERVTKERDNERARVDDCLGTLANVRIALNAISDATDGMRLVDRIDLLATRAREAEGQRDEWARQCNLASEAQAGALSEASRLRAAVEEAHATIAGIANAKRFDREVFEDDAAFVDWAQSRCRHEAKNLTAALSPAPVDATFGADTQDAITYALSAGRTAMAASGIRPELLNPPAPAEGEVEAECCGQPEVDRNGEATCCGCPVPTPAPEEGGEACGKRSVYGDVCTEPREHGGMHRCVNGGLGMSWGVCADEKASEA